MDSNLTRRRFRMDSEFPSDPVRWYRATCWPHHGRRKWYCNVILYLFAILCIIFHCLHYTVHALSYGCAALQYLYLYTNFRLCNSQFSTYCSCQMLHLYLSVVILTFKCFSGKYIYIESSAPRLENETAQIQSATITPYGTNPICLKFWYNMYGSSIGELNVYLKSENDSATEIVKVWSLHGDQGQGWHQAQVPVTSSNTFRVCVFAYLYTCS